MTELSILYVCMTYINGINGKRIIMLSNNDDGSIVPLVYDKADYEKNKEAIEKRLKMFADQANLVIEVGQYLEINTVRIIVPESRMTN